MRSNWRATVFLLAFLCAGIRLPAQPGSTASQLFDTTRTSAASGDARAQFNLGVMYARGQGVAQDNVEAWKWFSLVSAQGHEEARQNLAVVE
jgi:TPR repeat protein